MAFPATPLDVRVQIALGADPSNDPATWTWTDITAYTYNRDEIRITRGRSDEQSQAEPSSLSLTLDNRDGRFTPSNPTGAYYGQIGKNTPIRVLVDPGFFERFTGFVSEWPPRWDVTGNDRYVRVRANGILRRLNQGVGPIRSDLYHTLTTDIVPPKAYWPLEEVGGRSDTQFASPISGIRPMLPSVATTGTHRSVGTVSGSVDGAPGSGKAIDTSKGGQLTGYVPSSTTNGWRVDVNVLFTDPVLSSETGQIMRIHTTAASGSAVWGVYAKDTAGAELKVDAVGVASNSYTTSLILDDGAWHHVSLRVQNNAPNSSVDLWIDGVNVTTVAFTEPFGKVTTIVISPSGDCDAVGHVAYWDDWGNTDFAAAAFGHDGEWAVDRINRLCDAERIFSVDILPKTEDFTDALFEFFFVGTWGRDNTQSHSGTWSYKSATITHGQTTDTQPAIIPTGARQFSFWYKVSSEKNFDFFQCLVDGVVKVAASGEVDWTYAVVDVTGAFEVVFRYLKDTSASSGSDAAWIDDVAFSHSVPMGPQSGGSFLELLRDCETADLGSLYETLDGNLGYHDKTHFYNAANAMVLDYASGHIAPPFEPVDDDRETRNDLTVQLSNNSQVQVTDQDHVDRYGRYSAQVTANVYSDTDLIDNAGWRLHLGTNEKLRYPQINVNLASNPSLIPSWLAADVDSRIQVTNLPAGLPPDDIELIINGYTETLGLYTWDVELNCSPAELWDVAVVGDTTLGRLDSGSSTLTSSVTSSATSFNVTTTNSADLWTTAGGDFPLSILVGGEKMTVSAISPAVTDTFGRTTSGSLGTADSGQVWTVRQGAAAQWSTNGSAGLVAINAVNTVFSATLAGSLSDYSVKLILQVDRLAVGNDIDIELLGGWQDVSNFYAYRLTIPTTNLIDLRFSRVVGGAFTTTSATSGITHVAGQQLTLRFERISGRHRMKLWKSSDPEPPGWAIDTTDTTFGAGLLGVRHVLITGNTSTLPVTVAMDNLVVTNPQTFTISARSVNGVVNSHSAGDEVHVAQPAVLAL